jgi:hypothetical protein
MQVVRRLRGQSASTIVLIAIFVVAACTSGAAGSPASSAPVAPSASTPGVGTVSTAPASPVPSALDLGGTPGVLTPGSPGTGSPRVVTPKPGQLGVHPIAAERLAATVQDGRVVVEVTYATGVEPCYVLDSIHVQPGDHSFAITLRQGHGPGVAVCIQLAEIVRSLVDLGDLQPGAYTISDTQNGAAPISVTVP